MKSIMSRLSWMLRTTVLAISVAESASVDRIAFLRGQDVLVVGTNGDHIARWSSDQRRKGILRWLPDGQHLSYLAEGDNPAKNRLLVVVDLTGKIVREVAIPSLTDPPSDGPRYIENMSWVSDKQVWVLGSYNPRNCSLFKLDLDTSAVSSGQDGACGSFVPSPDGKHVAHLGLLAITSDEDRVDSVEIDDERIVYVGDGDRVRVVAGPVWSEDSQRVAFLQKRVGTNDGSVVALALTGRFDKTAVPAAVLDNPSIAWIDSQVVVGGASEALAIDHSHKRTERASSEVAIKFLRASQVRREAREARDHTARVIAKLGGREGVGWPQVQ